MATSVRLEPISHAKIGHDESVDLCKGFAIVLVVIGHAIQHYVARCDDNVLFRIIYSFHMPLFFILSGVVTSPDTPGRIAKSAKRLLLPVASWYLIQYFVGGFYKSLGLAAYLARFLISPDYGLWFLWTLFFVITLFVFIRKMEARVGIIAYPLAVILLYALPVNRFGLHLIKYYLPFLLLGYFFTRYRSMWHPWRGGILFAVSLAIYAALLPFWHRTAEQARIDKANLLHAGIGLIGFIGVRYLEGLAGSIIAIYLLGAVNGIIDVKILKWIGKQSLEIYACQFIGFEIIHGQGVTTIVVASLAALAISLILAGTLGQIRYIGTVLFGRTGGLGALARAS